MHVKVELLNQHERTSDGLVTKRLPFPIVNDSGKVGVDEVCQNDFAFKMNVASRKVLQECLMGIIITELNRERGAESENEEAME